MITNAVSDMQIVTIPAKSNEEIKHSAKRLKVAAYCRVSTDQEEQESSYEAQIDYYTEKSVKIPSGRWLAYSQTRASRVPKRRNVPNSSR